MAVDLLPEASLADGRAYPVPEGAHLELVPRRRTTDGFLRGDVRVVFPDGRAPHVVALDVPTQGGAGAVRALGDYAKLFPEPMPLATAD